MHLTVLAVTGCAVGHARLAHLADRGEDPFAGPGQPPSLSCRLYRDDGGQASGAPSAGQLRLVIERGA